MEEKKITFIGGGNMAYSLIGGLVAGNCPGANIRVSDPNEEGLQAMAAQLGTLPFTDNCSAIVDADAIVLAVKPQVLARVAHEISTTLAAQEEQPLILSIAAGVRIGDLERWLGGNRPVVRSMPNTPALLQSGATGLYANALVSEAQCSLAESILRAVGTTVWLESEAQIDAVTAVSGSGPAYFFLLMEAMEAAGQKLGLSEETARMLTLQTAFGAAKMALERPESSGELRRKVTSPGGTTERAIEVFQQQGLEDLVEQALTAARDRSVELASILGQENPDKESK